MAAGSDGMPLSSSHVCPGPEDTGKNLQPHGGHSYVLS